MKELSIEQKAARYDEAIKEAVIAHKDEDKHLKATLERIFPELHKSEDEMIKEEIIYHIQHCDDTIDEVAEKRMIAWLEKQGDKDNLIKELGKYKVKYTQEVLEKHINSMSNKENERLKKTTIAFLKDFADKGYENAVECISWLESQGEQKPVKNIVQIWKDMRFEIYMQANGDDMTRMFSLNDIDEIVEKISEQKLADKVEPKFKVGDWVIDERGIIDQITDLIENVTNHTYGYDTLNGEYFNDYTEGVRPWTIQDAKKGDILANDTIVLIVDHLGSFENRPIIYSWYFADSNKFYGKGTSEADKWGVKGFTPATKEQQGLLFQKMHESGYEWDAEKKELKKISSPANVGFDADIIKRVLRQKSTDSRELDYQKNHSYL